MPKKKSVKCKDCGWEGKLLDCKLSYVSAASCREPRPMCPGCGSENLTPIGSQGTAQHSNDKR